MTNQSGEESWCEGVRMDRLLLFPEPFPDETLYSLAVRYHRLVANDSYRRTSDELFGTYSRTCGSVLPCCLGNLSQRLGEMYTVAELVETRTLLPLYEPFLEDAAYESAVRCMEGRQGTGLKLSLGITASGLLKHTSFRYCEACIQADTRDFGVPYWHRIHMAVGVCVCPRHGNVLFSASFPDDADWRCMILPGESIANPVLNDSLSGAAESIAEMQLWGLKNPNCIRNLLTGEFLKCHLAEMGMYYQKRFRERLISAHIENRFKYCPHEVEYQAVTGDSEWVMRILRRRGRIIQPFWFYILCWMFEAKLEDLRGFKPFPSLRENKSNPCKIFTFALASEESVIKHRTAFMDDLAENCREREGYNWLYKHDRTWLKEYINSHRKVIVRNARVDWKARDAKLSQRIIAAYGELIEQEGKPKKITKSALMRKLPNSSAFLKSPLKFPVSMKVLMRLLETEHDYQIRKITWAAKSFESSKLESICLLLRAAGLRVLHISVDEIKEILDQRRRR